MVYGCSAKLAKFLIVVFNLLAFIAGLAILITCVVAYTSSPAKDEIMKVVKQANLDGDFAPVNSVLIAGMIVGGIIVCLSFLGCCGGLMENTCLLGLHSVIMILLLIVQLALAIAILAFKGKVKDALTKSVVDLGKKAENGEEAACEAFIDFAKTFKCCGAEGLAYPSCKDFQVCPSGTENKKCKDETWTFIWSNIKTFGIVGLVFLVIEIAAVIFTCCLIRGIRREYYNTV